MSEFQGWTRPSGPSVADGHRMRAEARAKVDAETRALAEQQKQAQAQAEAHALALDRLMPAKPEGNASAWFSMQQAILTGKGLDDWAVDELGEIVRTDAGVPFQKTARELAGDIAEYANQLLGTSPNVPRSEKDVEDFARTKEPERLAAILGQEEGARAFNLLDSLRENDQALAQHAIVQRQVPGPEGHDVRVIELRQWSPDAPFPTEGPGVHVLNLRDFKSRMVDWATCYATHKGMLPDTVLDRVAGLPLVGPAVEPA